MENRKKRKPPKAFDLISEEEKKAIQSKGGKQSAIVRRERRKFKEELKLLLELADEKGVNNNTKVSIALINKALCGDTRAFEIIRDTIGEKPIDKQEIKEISSEWYK